MDDKSELGSITCSDPVSTPSLSFREGRLPQRKQGVSDKPTHQQWNSDDYTVSLAAQRQTRFRQGALSTAPWATDTGTGGVTDAPSPASYHYHKKEEKEVSGKVGASAAGPHLHRPAQPAEPAVKVGALASPTGSVASAGLGSPGQAQPAAAPHKPADPPASSGKVTEQGWDQQEVREQARQRAAVQEAARRKAWGTPGLLG